MSHAWIYICMHLTLRAEVKNKLPGVTGKGYIVWKSCGHLSTLLWNRLPQSCCHLLQIRRQGSGVWLGDSSAFIVNPTATLIYNSYRQMEATPAGTQVVCTHTFKASKPIATQSHSFRQSAEWLCLLGCRLNTHCYGDGAWALSKETEMIYREVHPPWMAMRGKQQPNNTSA